MATALGKVMDGAGTNEFFIASSLPIQSEFVEVYLGEKSRTAEVLLAQIVDCTANNIYFDNERVFHHLAREDESLAKYTIFRSRALSLAILGKSMARRPDSPPKPGTNVYPADEGNFRRILGADDPSGFTAGSVAHQRSMLISIPWQRLHRSHVAAIGHTGSGKTWLAKLLILQALKAGESLVVVVDPNGEYVDLPARAEGLELIDAAGLKYPLKADFLSSVFALNTTESRAVDKFLSGRRSGEQTTIKGLEVASERTSDIALSGGEFREGQLTDLARLVEAASGVSIRQKLEGLSLRFSREATRMWTEAHSLVFSGVNCGTEEMDFGTSYLLKHIRDGQKKGKAKHVLVVIEEAHAFAPSLTATRSRNEIVSLAREGRKFGITLLLVTQRPRHVDPTVLSQCGTMFLFRLQNSDDVSHVLNLAPSSSSVAKQRLPMLWTGECLIVGDALGFPVLCEVGSYLGTIPHSQRETAGDLSEKV